MAMKFDGRVTQGPIRGLPFTSGSLSRLAFLILARPAGDSASPLMSFTILDRSRILPFLSMIPGFSLPAAPKRTSFMGSPPWCDCWWWMGVASCGVEGIRARSERAWSERPREDAAVEQDVLPGDEAGLGR